MFDSVFLADQLALAHGRSAGGARLARTDHRAGGIGGLDQPDRADRHRVHHLYRAVQPGAAVRLARPHQQRPGRPGTSSPHGWRRRRATSAAPARSATPTATPAARNSWRVVKALWDSWADDAVVDDRAGGRYAMPDRIRAIEHRGDFYQVAGPLNLPRCPQGRPVLVQAGSSDTGRRFAARHADAVFTAHMEKATAQDFYGDLKALAAAEGRDARPGADPAGPQPDDRIDRGRGAAPGARAQRARRPRSRAQAALRPVRRA